MMEIVEEQGQEYSPDRSSQEERDAHWSSTGLLEFIDRCLDKGVVIEARSSVRLLGIELLMLDYSSFVASVDTYLNYAEAIEQTMVVSAPDPQELLQRIADRQGANQQ